MTFKQRLKFYFIGFSIGLLVLAMVLNKRGCKSINNLKVEEIFYQKWEINDVMRCKLKCAGFASDSSFIKEVKNCKVNYGASEVHEKPCGKYVLESSEKSTTTYTLLAADCDSITKLLDITTTKPCDCK